ncbi:hypothetical protein DY000_02045682 [Brassica cretica]|uniref:Uncharacterized protein n=1 Tax=Brassica cretica TaxID=69181 RepID=A0ABQ7EUU7_BRACR|nr:hypothetical protein DY000_02045682 [Brassica cretica]
MNEDDENDEKCGRRWKMKADVSQMERNEDRRISTMIGDDQKRRSTIDEEDRRLSSAQTL